MVASPIHLQQVLLITVQLSILLPSTLLLELIHSATHLPRRMSLEKSLVVLYSPSVVQSKQQHSMILIAHSSLPYLVLVLRNLSSVRSWADLSSPLVVELKVTFDYNLSLLLPMLHPLIMVLSAATTTTADNGSIADPLTEGIDDLGTVIYSQTVEGTTGGVTFSYTDHLGLKQRSTTNYSSTQIMLLLRQVLFRCWC